MKFVISIPAFFIVHPAISNKWLILVKMMLPNTTSNENWQRCIFSQELEFHDILFIFHACAIIQGKWMNRVKATLPNVTNNDACQRCISSEEL